MVRRLASIAQGLKHPAPICDDIALIKNRFRAPAPQTRAPAGILLPTDARCLSTRVNQFIYHSMLPQELLQAKWYFRTLPRPERDGHLPKARN